MTLEQFKKKMKKIPDAPGVYFFLGKNKKVLYIGKATSLRDRLRSYFVKDIAGVRSPVIAHMVEKARSIDYRQTDSVLEALILEASLIRAHKPKANTERKDDKSFNHVVITKESFPRVLVVRGKELELLRKKLLSRHFRETEGTVSKGFFAIRYEFGPFPHGLQLIEAMKLIRRIFPYRDNKCTPCGEKKNLQCRPCFSRHIGLCPGVCTGEIGKAEYHCTTRHIAMLFQGKKKLIKRELERDMRRAAKEELFEEAKRFRTQLFALTHIHDVALIKDEYRAHRAEGDRIEAYDIAHLRGTAAVGVMTVVEDGVAAKSEYRKFRLRSSKAGDDPGALREVLSRRLAHEEWPLPRLIVVDGAVAQMNAAKKVLAQYGVVVPVVGVVKDERHRPRGLQGDKALVARHDREILLANAEAHRFAIGYHRTTSRKNLTL
ncbi:MAG: GIY-YIG nuclease family protein [Patescibacteria group bacterium]|nr:GIY-YIG nuclease family protein [Patescibacteria group bacterium]